MWAAELDIVGNLAYFVTPEWRSESGGGLQIVDVSDPETPVLVSYRYYEGGANDVQVVENLAYVIGRVDASSSASSVLEILDVSNPRKPTHLADFAGPEYPNDLQIVGNSAYVSNRSGPLQVYDVTDPVRPVLRGEYETVANTVTVAGELVYATSSTSVEILRVRELERALVLPAIRR